MRRIVFALVVCLTASSAFGQDVPNRVMPSLLPRYGEKADRQIERYVNGSLLEVELRFNLHRLGLDQAQIEEAVKRRSTPKRPMLFL